MNRSTFSADTHLFGNAPNASRYLCDYRVYNNCITAQEVKEISKALTLHYTMEGTCGGGVGENLISNSMPTVAGGTTGWAKAGTDWTGPTLVDCNISPSGKAIRATYTGTGQAQGGIHHPPIDWEGLSNGELYTFSAYLRASKNCTIIFKNEMMTSYLSGYTANQNITTS
jgi:hypothetical protein